MKFYIKQKVFTFKDQFSIMDEQQNVKYQIKGKFLSLRNKLVLIDHKGLALLRAERKLFRFLPKYFVYDTKNQVIAEVKRIFSLRPKFDLRIPHKDYHVDGSFFAHSFNIYDNTNNLVASISKKIISWGDTYEIEIIEEEKLELLLFLVIIIDQVVHERHNR
jgi:uncharacterized protein YxjI